METHLICKEGSEFVTSCRMQQKTIHDKIIDISNVWLFIKWLLINLPFTIYLECGARYYKNGYYTTVIWMVSSKDIESNAFDKIKPFWIYIFAK